MPRPPVIVAAAAPFERDLERCFERIRGILAAARARGGRLVVLPESALGGYLLGTGRGETVLDVPPALEPDGPEIARLIRLARDLVVCVGYTEAGPLGLHASAVCVSGDGVLGHHRKVHLPATERLAYVPGEGFRAFDTPVGRLGMLVCYDKLFPEAGRALALDGAEIVCSLAAWPADRDTPARRLAADRQTRHFDAIDQARAIENQVVWVSSNQTGDWGALRFLGSAKIVCPDGVVLARARSGLAVARVDVRASIERTRGIIDHLADRRPGAYGGEALVAG